MASADRERSRVSQQTTEHPFLISRYQRSLSAIVRLERVNVSTPSQCESSVDMFASRVPRRDRVARAGKCRERRRIIW